MQKKRKIVEEGESSAEIILYSLGPNKMDDILPISSHIILKQQ